MANEKHEVHLKEERRKLRGVVSKGRNKVVVIQRTHIFFNVDEGKMHWWLSLAVLIPVSCE